MGCCDQVVTKSDASAPSHSVHVAAVNKSESPQQQSSSSDTVPQSELQSILHEYKDCFPESLPEGLPVERDVVHTIPTEAGAAPPYKPVHTCTDLALQKTLKLSIRF